MSSVNLVNFNGIDRKKNYLISSPAKKDTKFTLTHNFNVVGYERGA